VGGLDWVFGGFGEGGYGIAFIVGLVNGIGI